MNKHSALRIALINSNPTVGAYVSNLKKLKVLVAEAYASESHLIVAPELALMGYGGEDYWTHPSFVDAQLDSLKKFLVWNSVQSDKCGKAPIVTIGVAIPVRERLYNCAVVIQGNTILGIVPKEHLPNSSIFHEDRVFAPGKPGMFVEIEVCGQQVQFGDLMFECSWGTFATAVCQDKWQPCGPVTRRNALVTAIINGSPGRFGMQQTRMELVQTLSGSIQGVVVDTNLVGGTDGTVFDGGGFVVDRGRMVLSAQRFVEGVQYAEVNLRGTKAARLQETSWRTHDTHDTSRVVSVSMDLWKPRAAQMSIGESPRDADTEYTEARHMAILGMEDYVAKTAKHPCYAIAVSGGLDSLLAAIFAHEALTVRFAALHDEEREEAIRASLILVSMPTVHNRTETRLAAQIIAETLGATFLELSIDEEYESRIERLCGIAQRHGRTVSNLLDENVQPRIRGALMWDIATLFTALWLHTGNVSEKSVGFTTVGGDNMGGYSPISGLQKTFIIRMVKWYRRTRQEWAAMIDSVFQTPASPELREGQEDERELMPMVVLDGCISLYFGEQLNPVDIYTTMRERWTDADLEGMYPGYREGQLKGWVKRFFALYPRSVFKWPYAPLGVHYGNVDLDRERALHLPVAASMEWLEPYLRELDALPN